MSKYNKVAKYRPQLTLWEIESIVAALTYALENGVELGEHIDPITTHQTYTKMQMFLMKARAGINTPASYAINKQTHRQIPVPAEPTGSEMPDLNDPEIIAINKYETLGGAAHHSRVWNLLSPEEKKLVAFHKANKREPLTDEMQKLYNEYMMEEFNRKMKEGNIEEGDL